MATLLVKANITDPNGRIQNITPASAGWKYVGFSVYRLMKGDRLEQPTNDREACLVIVSGRLVASAAGISFGPVGERESPFNGSPWAVYVPCRSSWAVEAISECELAICTGPATAKLPARIIRPVEVAIETRGRGTNTRAVRNILPETQPAERLLIVEVITPSGNWSSYPPHKHDRDSLPSESQLEETYYYRLNPPQGFALQRIYTDDRSIDETVAPSDGDVVLVPRGYHPVAAAHGYELYYLNVMAGPTRRWVVANDPAHAWIVASQDAACARSS